MNELSKYDPYAIDQIQFYTQKRTKFTTLKSIFISIIIIILTFIVNWSIIQNIWIPRSKLKILQNQQTMDFPFTSSFLCIIAQQPGQQAPFSSLIQLDPSTNQMLSAQLIKSKSIQSQLTASMRQKIALRDYYCYNLLSLHLQKLSYLQLRIFGLGDILLKTYSVAQFLLQEQPQFYYFNQNKNLTNMLTAIFLKKIKATIYDKLWVNYQPQIIYGVQDGNVKAYVTEGAVTTQNQNVYKIYSEINSQTELTKEIIIERVNIGEIIGKFFSWFSIFVLIFTFIITPIVEQTFKLTLAQLIYNNPKLTLIQSSLLSFFKYILSYFIKNKFNEEIIHTAYDQLQKDLDILNLVKRQVLMRKLIMENQVVGKISTEENNNEDIAQNDDYVEIQAKQVSLVIDGQEGSQYDTKGKEYKKQNIRINNNNNKSQQSADQDSKKFTILSDPQTNNQFFLFKLIRSFDIGQTTINLLSNKGYGYRNAYNPIIFILFSILLLIFLILAGFLTISSQQRLSTVLQGRQSKHSIKIDPQNMIFRAKKSPMDQWQFQIRILDDDMNLVENVKTMTGTACSKYVKGFDQNDNQLDWMCLKQPLILQNDGKGNKRILFMRLYTSNPFAFIIKPIQIVFRETQFQRPSFSRPIRKLSIIPSANIDYFPLQILNNVQEQQYLLTSYQRISIPSINKYKGVMFQLKSQILKIQLIQNTIWDVIDKSWGIFIICFSLILSKLARYLNVREREKIMTNKENQNRNDIVTVIKMQYLLQNKVFSKELQAVGTYFKQKLKKNI